MKTDTFGITIRDRISRHFKIIVIFTVLSLVLLILYIGTQWSLVIGGSELIAIGISFTALGVSGASFIQALMLHTRQDDIKALHGLSRIDDLLKTAMGYELRDIDNNKIEILNVKRTSLLEIDEAISGASARFREQLYRITKKFRGFPDDYIINYLLRRTKREEKEDEMRYRPETEGEPLEPLGMDPRIELVVEVQKAISQIIGRMEYVYFGKSINPKDVEEQP